MKIQAKAFKLKQDWYDNGTTVPSGTIISEIREAGPYGTPYVVPVSNRTITLYDMEVKADWFEQVIPEAKPKNESI